MQIRVEGRSNLLCIDGLMPNPGTLHSSANAWKRASLKSPIADMDLSNKGELDPWVPRSEILKGQTSGICQLT